MVPVDPDEIDIGLEEARAALSLPDDDGGGGDADGIDGGVGSEGDAE